MLTGPKPKDPTAALLRAETELNTAKARAEAKQAERDAKLAAARARGKTTIRGRPPGPNHELKRAQEALEHATKAAAEAQPAQPTKANITDADSRIMKDRKGYLQGYNAQAIVNRHQLVIACTVTQDANDIEQYEPMLDQLKHNLQSAAIPDEQDELMLADAGYCSEANSTSPPKVPTG